MPSALDTLNLVVLVAVIVSYGYTAYSGLRLRRTLASGLYRRHALGVALVAIVFAADQYGVMLPTTGILNIVSLAIFYIFAIVLLYWVDTSILAARKSDPLYRNTLEWSRLRWVVWGAAAVAIVFVSVVALLFPPSEGPPRLPSLLNAIFTIVFLSPIYLAAISGVIVMPVAARRSRDMAFRMHLEWFFVFIVIELVLAGVVGQSVSGPLSVLVDGIGLLIGVYPLYRSATTLIPLYKFSRESRRNGASSQDPGTHERPTDQR